MRSHWSRKIETGKVEGGERKSKRDETDQCLTVSTCGGKGEKEVEKWEKIKTERSTICQEAMRHKIIHIKKNQMEKSENKEMGMKGEN